ncbi:type II secretion system GspH family protein [Sulfurimonas sp.]|nr:type II secretion system GspH family protein [Sulfurimonas sp.]
MKRQAFSLIELLIVIMIIGIVYTLVIGNFNRVAEEKTQLSLENLKENLLSLKYEKSAKLLCLDDCSTCEILLDGEVQKTIEDLLDENIRMYRYDTLYGYTEIEQEVYFNTEDIEEDVCFSYEVDKAGVGTQVLVEFKEKFYDYSSYFTKTKVYNSMGEAQEAREDLMREVRQ